MAKSFSVVGELNSLVGQTVALLDFDRSRAQDENGDPVEGPLERIDLVENQTLVIISGKAYLLGDDQILAQPVDVNDDAQWESLGNGRPLIIGGEFGTVEEQEEEAQEEGESSQQDEAPEILTLRVGKARKNTKDFDRDELRNWRDVYVVLIGELP